MTLTPLDVACPYCSAEPGDPCVGRTITLHSPHVERATAADHALHRAFGPHALPMVMCRRCGEFDEMSPDGEAAHLCIGCLDDSNRPEGM